MTMPSATLIKPARFEQKSTMRIAGLRLRLDDQAAQKIPELWQQLVPHMGKVPAQVGHADYGVCIGVDDSNSCFDYMAGMEIKKDIADRSSVPTEWFEITIPEQQYAIFAHQQHVSQLHQTIHDIFDQWLPGSGYVHAVGGAGKVHFIERYGEAFNPQTGTGDIEIWLPVKAR